MNTETKMMTAHLVNLRPETLKLIKKANELAEVVAEKKADCLRWEADYNATADAVAKAAKDRDFAGWIAATEKMAALAARQPSYWEALDAWRDMLSDAKPAICHDCGLKTDV